MMMDNPNLHFTLLVKLWVKLTQTICMNANHLCARLTIKAPTSSPNRLRNRSPATSVPIFRLKLSVFIFMLELGNHVQYFLVLLMRLEVQQTTDLMLQMTLL